MPSESELRVPVRRPRVNRPDTGWRSPSLGSMKTLERKQLFRDLLAFADEN